MTKTGPQASGRVASAALYVECPLPDAPVRFKIIMPANNIFYQGGQADGF